MMKTLRMEAIIKMRQPKKNEHVVKLNAQYVPGPSTAIATYDYEVHRMPMAKGAQHMIALNHGEC